MKRILLTAILLLLTGILPSSCTWDLNPQPTVTAEKIEDISDGIGKVILHFEPAIRQDIILKTAAVYYTDCETVTPGQIEVPAWTRNLTINFRVIYNSRTDVGMDVTFKIVKAYGDCQIGNPSEVTLKILK